MWKQQRFRALREIPEFLHRILSRWLTNSMWNGNSPTLNDNDRRGCGSKWYWLKYEGSIFPCCVGGRSGQVLVI